MSSSSLCLMLYFWWGCRGNLKFTTFGSESPGCTHLQVGGKWLFLRNCILFSRKSSALLERPPFFLESYFVCWRDSASAVRNGPRWRAIAHTKPSLDLTTPTWTWWVWRQESITHPRQLCNMQLCDATEIRIWRHFRWSAFVAMAM